MVRIAQRIVKASERTPIFYTAEIELPWDGPDGTKGVGAFVARSTVNALARALFMQSNGERLLPDVTSLSRASLDEDLTTPLVVVHTPLATADVRRFSYPHPRIGIRWSEGECVGSEVCAALAEQLGARENTERVGLLAQRAAGQFDYQAPITSDTAARRITTIANVVFETATWVYGMPAPHAVVTTIAGIRS